MGLTGPALAGDIIPSSVRSLKVPVSGAVRLIANGAKVLPLAIEQLAIALLELEALPGRQAFRLDVFVRGP